MNTVSLIVAVGKGSIGVPIGDLDTEDAQIVRDTIALAKRIDDRRFFWTGYIFVVMVAVGVTYVACLATDMSNITMFTLCVGTFVVGGALAILSVFAISEENRSDAKQVTRHIADSSMVAMFVREYMELAPYFKTVMKKEEERAVV